MTDDIKEKIYDILVKECGAYDDAETRSAFRQLFPGCGEYRFQGSLGFGGKVWASNNRVWVNCYNEDNTPERLAMIRRTNGLLEAFVAA